MKPTTVLATAAIASAFLASSSVSSLFEPAVGRRPAPATSPPPEGYRRVVDDTGVLAVSIPADWAVQTAPAVVDTLDEVSLVPAIEAGPTVEEPVCDGCSSYFAPPTVQVRAFPYGAVTVDILFVSWSADQAPQTAERQAELTQLFDTILSTVERSPCDHSQQANTSPAYCTGMKAYVHQR